MQSTIVRASTQLPPPIAWLDRWVFRVGTGVFVIAVLANVALSPAREWVPWAFSGAFMGIGGYYLLRLVVRFHAVIRNPHMNARRVRSYLVFVLVVLGCFVALLLAGLFLWPRAYVLNLLAVPMPTGVAMSVVRLWKETFEWPIPGEAR